MIALRQSYDCPAGKLRYAFGMNLKSIFQIENLKNTETRAALLTCAKHNHNLRSNHNFRAAKF
jgi:hypothetical protein